MNWVKPMKQKRVEVKNTVCIEEVDVLDLPDQMDVPDMENAANRGLPVLPMAMPLSVYQAYKKRKFRLLREAKERIESVLLEMAAWNVLWQVDGRRSVEEIAMNLTMTIEETVYHIECLRLMRIICPVDAVYLPDFIMQKTAKGRLNQSRRRSDEDPD